MWGNFGLLLCCYCCADHFHYSFFFILEVNITTSITCSGESLLLINFMKSCQMGVILRLAYSFFTYAYTFCQFTFACFHVFSVFMPFLYHIMIFMLVFISLSAVIHRLAWCKQFKWPWPTGSRVFYLIEENLNKVLSFDLIDKHIYGKFEVIYVCLHG
jgi:hypothetical protein